MKNDYNPRQKEFLEFLKLLDNNGLLEHLIISGSWSEYVYFMGEVLSNFNLTLRTLDIDFLVKNIRKPNPPKNLISIVDENNYTYEKDVLSGTTKIFTPDGMEIEFLVEQRGSGVESVLKTNLGVSAQALRHMEILSNNTITVDIFGMNVQVPCPEAYVIHKMVINQDRAEKKMKKDANSIINLMPYLDFEKFEIVFMKLSKGEKKRVHKFFEVYQDKLNVGATLDMQIELAKFKAVISNLDQKQNRDKNISHDHIK